MKIVRKPFKPGDQQLDKRTYLPFIVESKCPKCGKKDKRDLRTDYLSYPSVGVPEDITFGHGEYGANDYHEWTEQVVVGFTLKAAK